MLHLQFNEPIVRPTESFLRKFFVQFGTVMDISVKEYAIYRVSCCCTRYLHQWFANCLLTAIPQEQNMQEGYGFVSFETEDCIMRAINACQNVIVHGVAIKCTITHQHNPHVKKQPTKKGTSPTASTALAMANMNMGGKYPPVQRQYNNVNGMPNSNNSMNWSTAGPMVGTNVRGFSSLNPPVPMPGQLLLNSGMQLGGSLGSPFSNDSTPMASSLPSLDSSYDDGQQSLFGGATMASLSSFKSAELTPGW
jgi:RNA recognition motif-containing protein